MRKLALVFLFASLLGCGGRGQSDLYRAYNVSPMLDSSTGKATEDLATQNRNSLQTGVDTGYSYVAPEQPDSKSATDVKTTDKAEPAAGDQAADDAAIPDDVTIPDDVAAADASNSTKAIADKIDNLKQTVSDLNKK